MTQTDDRWFALLVRTLGRFAPLNAFDTAALRTLPVRVTREPAHHYLLRTGERPEECSLLLSGYVCRHKIGPQGGRQIVALHLPGDLLDLQHLLLARADHNIQTVSTAEVARFPKAALRALGRTHPAIGEALWRETLIDASIFREWVLNVGRRDAVSRVAHLLCEFAYRATAAGIIARPDRFELPISQEHIADATGLTPVHVNRMLQQLSADGAIARDKRQVEILDSDAMRRIADFDPAYLHPEMIVDPPSDGTAPPTPPRPAVQQIEA